MFRHPKVELDGNGFIHPISNEAWIVTLCCILLGIILLKYNIDLEKEKLKMDCYAGLYDSSWSTIILLLLGSFFQQGKEIIPF